MCGLYRLYGRSSRFGCIWRRPFLLFSFQWCSSSKLNWLGKRAERNCSLPFAHLARSSIMIQTKLKCVPSTKVTKGTGYHLDILIAGLLVSISGLFGLPWICAAPVRSIAHIASLSKYSNTHAPGEKARLIDIKDQRLTNIGVHLLIGCTIFAAPIIRKIPVAALFGIFLYFGIVSIPGTQLFSRLKMTFIPTKYHPNVGYLRRVCRRTSFRTIDVLHSCIVAVRFVKWNVICTRSSKSSLLVSWSRLKSPTLLFSFPSFWSYWYHFVNGVCRGYSPIAS